MLDLVRNVSVVNGLGVAVAVATLGVAIAYAARPAESRLALMRPLSLATIFAALCAFSTGFALVLEGVGNTAEQISWKRVALGAAESFIPLVIAFGLLTISWVLVAMGLRRG